MYIDTIGERSVVLVLLSRCIEKEDNTYFHDYMYNIHAI